MRVSSPELLACQRCTVAPIRDFSYRVCEGFPSDSVGEPYLFASLLLKLARLLFRDGKYIHRVRGFH